MPLAAENYFATRHCEHARRDSLQRNLSNFYVYRDLKLQTVYLFFYRCFIIDQTHGICFRYVEELFDSVEFIAPAFSYEERCLHDKQNIRVGNAAKIKNTFGGVRLYTFPTVRMHNVLLRFINRCNKLTHS